MNDYYAEGLAAYEAEEYAAAIEALTKGIRLALGEQSELYLLRGQCFAALARWNAALDDYNSALRFQPTLADAYNERGNATRALGNRLAAIADYGYAIQCDPDHCEAYLNRALCYEEEAEYSAAIADCNQALVVDSGLALAYELRGRMYARLGDWRRAIDDLERYLRMGGGRQYDNHSETQSLLLSLRARLWLRRLRPRGAARKRSS